MLNDDELRSFGQRLAKRFKEGMYVSCTRPTSDAGAYELHIQVVIGWPAVGRQAATTRLDGVEAPTLPPIRKRYALLFPVTETMIRRDMIEDVYQCAVRHLKRMPRATHRYYQSVSLDALYAGDHDGDFD